jgi:SIR2-like domain
MIYSAENWKHDHTLQKHLADLLTSGKLALVIGAGVSKSMGLPSWDELLDQILADLPGPHPNLLDTLDPKQKAEFILTEYCSGEQAFNDIVKNALYKNFSVDFQSLREHSLLAAIASIAMIGSKKSGSFPVINFNFDDILELYLRFHGFSVQPITNPAGWNNDSEVNIYHLHGFLPHSQGKASNTIVFDQASFSAAHTDQWHSKALQILSSRFCLYIGVSGKDGHLDQLILKSIENHPALSETRLPFAGVKFSLEDDPLNFQWKRRKIFVKTLDNWNETPSYLFKICQLAASGEIIDLD